MESFVVGNKPTLQYRVFALLSYLGVLCLIPLYFARNSEYAQFHARQGFVVFFIYIVGSFATIVPGLGPLIYFVALWLAIAFSILGILSVLFARAWRLPVVYGLATRL
ncbi:MAG: hypothetical protein HQL63_15685 [Magnetococcales bacterium]|nr:hypothetical protein [Magnetococcales bacterium]